MPEINYTHKTSYTKKNGEVVQKEYNYTRLVKGVPRGPKTRVHSEELIQNVLASYEQHGQIKQAAVDNNITVYHAKNIINGFV